MQLIDPTGTAPEQHNQRAPQLAALEGKVIGLLSNGKLNADLLLQETGRLFVENHGCQLGPLRHKANPSAPAPAETLAELAANCDFMLTATGD